MWSHEERSGTVLELSCLDKSNDSPARITEQPVGERVNTAIERAFEYGGFVNLSVLLPKNAFIKKLNMTSLPGQYRLVALTRSDDPRAGLLEWWEPGHAPFRGLVRFGDDPWDARTVSADPAIAQDLFKELFDHGQLSVGLAQLRSPWDPKP